MAGQLIQDDNGVTIQGFAPVTTIVILASTPFDCSNYVAFRPATATNYVHNGTVVPFTIQANVITVCERMNTLTFANDTTVEFM